MRTTLFILILNILRTTPANRVSGVQNKYSINKLQLLSSDNTFKIQLDNCNANQEPPCKSEAWRPAWGTANTWAQDRFKDINLRRLLSVLVCCGLLGNQHGCGAGVYSDSDINKNINSGFDPSSDKMISIFYFKMRKRKNWAAKGNWELQKCLLGPLWWPRERLNPSLAFPMCILR